MYLVRLDMQGNQLSENNLIKDIPERLITISMSKAGKEYSLKYLMASHHVMTDGTDYFYLGEAFYPTYTTTRVGNMVTTVFNGYAYTHAVLAKFNEQGELIWDNCFKMELGNRPMYVKRLKSLLQRRAGSLCRVDHRLVREPLTFFALYEHLAIAGADITELAIGFEATGQAIGHRTRDMKGRLQIAHENKGRLGKKMGKGGGNFLICGHGTSFGTVSSILEPGVAQLLEQLFVWAEINRSDVCVAKPELMTARVFVEFALYGEREITKSGQMNAIAIHELINHLCLKCFESSHKVGLSHCCCLIDEFGQGGYSNGTVFIEHHF